MQRNYRVVGLILITFFVISFLTNILGALNPSATLSYDLSETMAGFLPFSFFIAYGIMSIPAGFLLEKYGEKALMISGFILAFAGSLLFSIFPTFWMFIVSLFTIGTGMAILQVVINPLLRVAGGEEHYAFNSVLAQLLFGAASFISPLVYSWLVVNIAGNTELGSSLQYILHEGMSWTTIYWIFSIISLLMIMLVSFINMPRVTLKDDEKVGSRKLYMDLFKNRTVLIYFFGIFAYVGAEQGISYWMSKFLQLYHDLDFQTTGALAVGRFWGLMTIGGLIGLVLLKLLDSKLVLKIFTISGMLCFAGGIFGSEDISFYAFQFCGFFLSVMYPILISLALNSIKEHHGSVAGILMSGIMGGAVLQLLIGFIADTFSLKIGMSLVFIALIYILFISFWAKPLITNKTLKMESK